MTTEKVICDECLRVKGESNHWHKIGLFRDNGRIALELGDLRGPRIGEESLYTVFDLCGEQCFYKHIAKLLKLNPMPEGETQP